MNGEIRIVDDLPGAFASLVEDEVEHRALPDSFSLALAGGSTPRPCYERLAGTAIDWALVTAVWGDERCVPLDHPDSNYRMAAESLLDRVSPLAAVYPMDCAHGAEAYETVIGSLLPLDLVHLGMGDDGHVASLFPGSPALDAPSGRLVVETGDELHEHARVTLTFSAIAVSHVVVLTVSGAKKREMFSRIRSGEQLPAGRVEGERVIWLVDSEAAG